METFLQNLNKKQVLNLSDTLEYKEGEINKIVFTQREDLTILIFAFDKGQNIPEHSHPSKGDALIQVLDGEGIVSIDGEEFLLKKGESIVMCANSPHAIKATEKFKIMLTIVKSLT